MKRKLLLPALVGCTAAYAACHSGITVRQYTIKTSRIPKGKALRLAVVSDLHSELSQKRREALAALLQQEHPDLIAMPGDIVDDIRPQYGAADLLQRVQGIAPLYFSLGNHECRSQQLATIPRLLGRYGVHCLCNSWEEVTVAGIPICIGGLNDPEHPSYQFAGGWLHDAQTVFSSLEQSDRLRILLSHRPEKVFAYRAMPFDLVLSGHAHGGQVRVPGLLNGLYAPNQGLLPPYAGGMYRHPTFTHVVSRGVSHYMLLPRVCNRPEVVIITVCRE